MSTTAKSGKLYCNYAAFHLGTNRLLPETQHQTQRLYGKHVTSISRHCDGLRHTMTVHRRFLLVGSANMAFTAKVGRRRVKETERSVSMRCTCCLFVLLAAGMLSSPAAGSQPGCSMCAGGTGSHSYYEQACGAPGGFSFTPGCCRCKPTCCDNAWDGYCEHKARWQGFWYMMGTGAFKWHGSVVPRCHASCVTGSCQPQLAPQPVHSVEPVGRSIEIPAVPESTSPQTTRRRDSH